MPACWHDKGWGQCWMQTEGWKYVGRLEKEHGVLKSARKPPHTVDEHCSWKTQATRKLCSYKAAGMLHKFLPQAGINLSWDHRVLLVWFLAGFRHLESRADTGTPLLKVICSVVMRKWLSGLLVDLLTPHASPSWGSDESAHLHTKASTQQSPGKGLTSS